MDEKGCKDYCYFRHIFLLTGIIALIFMCLCCFSVETQAGSKWVKIKKNKVTGSWLTNGYNKTERWADSYKTTFKKNGKVIQIGYRNKDYGTFRISKDKKKIFAKFNKCYYDTPGEGYVRIGKYQYTVTYRLTKKGELYAKYSENATETNAQSGYLYRL